MISSNRYGGITHIILEMAEKEIQDQTGDVNRIVRIHMHNLTVFRI